MKKLIIMAIAALPLMAEECTPQETLDLGPVMVSVTGGSFSMGSGATAPDGPVHTVTLSSYSIGKFAVTQKEWKWVMNSLPSDMNKTGDNYPVTNISWLDIVGTMGATEVINGITYYSNGFIYQLNEKTGKKYRLPTEAEWEYAARGGHRASTPNKNYSGSDDYNAVAWVYENSNVGSGRQLHEVGKKASNELGIYDMSGNVWEWCSDWYLENYYSTAAATGSNPKGPVTGSLRVIRGGSWDVSAPNARVFYRDCGTPGLVDDNIGFRLAL